MQSKEVFEDAQRSRRERMLRECVCCLLYFVLLCCCSVYYVAIVLLCSLVVFLSLFPFVYRYLGGIESENERSEVVVDLARELTDLGLDPQIFL